MAAAHAAQEGAPEGRNRGLKKNRALTPILALAALLHGCASAPPDVRHQADLGAIAVVAGTRQPEISFRGFPRSNWEGAARGAGAALIQCATMPGIGCSGDAMCGVVLTVWLGVCGIGTVAGGAVGAAVSPGAASVRSPEAAMAGALDLKAIQETLRDQVTAAFAARGVAPVDPRHADTLAEVALSKAGLDQQHQLYMHATVRLVRRTDGGELSSTEYVHTGPRYLLALWSQDGAELLLAALKAGYESLGAHIHDSVFLLYPFADREWQAGSILVTAYGLAPLDPGLVTPWVTLPQVASLRPTLRWQAFPREADLAADPGAMARVRNVRYDLVIARELDLAPEEIVYRREGLTQAAHTLEAPLAGGTNYYWTVRARFELDGRSRVTSWGSTHYAARETWTAPSHFSYRFRTPD